MDRPDVADEPALLLNDGRMGRVARMAEIDAAIEARPK